MYQKWLTLYRRHIRAAYEKVVEILAQRRAGLNQHALKGELAGYSAIDLPGTGKGRGAVRVVYSEKDDVVTIKEIVDYHRN